MTDPIADLLTRIRNGYSATKQEVMIPHSKLKYAIAKVIEANNYVGKVEEKTVEGRKMIVVEVKQGLKPTFRRVSKPGQRIYVKAGELKKVKNGLGMAVLSTNKGVMTGYEAFHLGLGGEHICNVY